MRGGTMVRCLGIGKEHLFMSIDPTRNRVCSRCAAKMEAGAAGSKIRKNMVHECDLTRKTIHQG
jgi:hypothetical protein